MLLFSVDSHIQCVQCNSEEVTDSDIDCMSILPEPANCTTCLQLDQNGSCSLYTNFDFCMVLKIYDVNRK